MNNLIDTCVSSNMISEIIFSGKYAATEITHKSVSFYDPITH